VQYLGVITGRHKQSTSPAFQQAAIDALGLDLRYERWATELSGLSTRVTGLRAPSVLGANVTIPHKEAVIPLLDELDPLVKRIGAVNTILNRSGNLVGYNTDAEGFIRALREDGGFQPRGKHAVVAGAGGAARAVIVALCDAELGSVAILNRTKERARRLTDELRRTAGHTVLEDFDASPQTWARVAPRAQLLVNCTSLGSAGPEEDQSAVPAEVLRPGMLVYDLVYLPIETRLLREAQQARARALGGLPMLVYQGAASFKIWTGLDAPTDVMMAAARSALGVD